MKKNSRGFTLVELLVVIAIMGSILVLAITSLNKISKAKKNEAKKKVENQIELAAKQYFEANEYLFEALTTSGSGSTTIPLIKLISSDYINTLTDPTTGKKFHECSTITITRMTNKKYTFSYDPNITQCSGTSFKYNYTLKNGEQVSISGDNGCYEYGAKKLDYGKESMKRNLSGDGNSWCTGSEIIKITASVTNGGTISNIILKEDEEEKEKISGSNLIYVDQTSSGTQKNIVATVTTTKNSTQSVALNYNLDNVAPTITSSDSDYNSYSGTSLDNVNWINNNSSKTKINYNVAYNDLHSGISSSSSYYSNSGSNTSVSTGVSVNHEADGKYTDAFKACDEAGNCTEVKKYYGIDKTSPKLEYKNTKNAATSNPSWTNQTAYFDVVATDLTSGINTNASFDTGNGTLYSIVDGTNKSVKDSSDLTEITNGYKLAGDYLSNEGNRNKYHKVCDKAGNCTENTIYAKIDKTAPTLNYTITSKWLDGKTANVNIYNGKCSINSAIKCPYENAKWTKDNISFNVTASDALSGINETSSFETNGTGSDENASNKKGVFYVEWDNEPNGGSATTQFDIVTVNKNEQGKYIRNNAGYWAINYGKRRQSYTVCDKAGNCTTKTTYARFDKIAPEIINVSAPNGSSSSSYCSGKPVVATRFRVRDNAQVYNVYHYMSNEDVDINKDKDTLSYFTEGFNSVKNGGINIYNTLKTKKSDFKQVNDVNNNGTLYEMARYWADTDVSTANSIGCGTIAGNTKKPDYNYANQYCNFISAIDGAGNKTVSRICGSARRSSTNVKSK